MFDRHGAVWRKSTRSNGNSGDCVEVADNQPGVVGVRDSKDQYGPVLVFTPDQWTTFARCVRRGTFESI
ncbi:DUF397 domain-containing protein [Solwaraspora sp. WMMB335]|uniref:DUF397 domain-containing protein n=1 Tax=Solwaraspora sp. WMMB335 TaxID=3404118 RepID=UPI003B95DD2D